MTEGSAYTFGDSEIATRRLELVAAVFESSTRRFLAEDIGLRRPELAVDLGCGPGHTTRLIAEITGAARTVGFDTSARFLDTARARSVAGVDFLEHDVLRVPFPVGPAELVYCRLLLAHLADPEAAVATWMTQVANGGLFAADEVEYIEATHPVLARYEGIVVALVASRGASMYAGPILDALVSGPGWRRRSSRLSVHPVPTRDAAAMYAMNLSTWRDDPFIRAHYTDAELDELQRGLQTLTKLETPETVEWGLRQVVLERTAS